MKYWLVSAVLSAWVAISSIFLNGLLAIQLALADYGQWVKWTSLLPLLSGILAPFTLYCSRVESSQSKSVDAIASFLIDVATAMALLAALFLFAASYASVDLTITAGCLIWFSNLARISIDGVLLSDRIIKLGLFEKIARVVIPSMSLLAIIIIRPNHFVSTGFSLTAGILFAATGMIVWLRSISKRVNLNFKYIWNLYIRELPSAYLIFVSAGIFSVPLYLFAKYNDQKLAGIVGVVVTVVSGASAFSSMLLSRPIFLAAEFFQRNGNIKGVGIFPFVTASIFSCIGSFILISIFFTYKGIESPLYYGAVTGFLVLIELLQSFMTMIFIRLGYRHIIFSAMSSAIVNITFSVFVESPIYLILAWSMSQFIFFFLPGLWKLTKN